MTSPPRIFTPLEVVTEGHVGSVGSGDIPELNVVLGVWWRPLSGADSGGGG